MEIQVHPQEPDYQRNLEEKVDFNFFDKIFVKLPSLAIGRRFSIIGPNVHSVSNGEIAKTARIEGLACR